MKHSLILKLLKPAATLVSGIGKEKKLLIMIYHRVLDQPDFMRPGEVDKVAFAWQMELLATYFNVLPLESALDRLSNDTLPPRAVSITFDDGYADNYTNALPILQQFNLKATFFIASGFLDGGRMWNDTVIEAIRNLTAPLLDLCEQGLGVYETTDEVQKSNSAQQIIQKIKHLQFSERARLVKAIAEKLPTLPNDLMMTSEQLIKLHQSGMDIGGHTVNHPILAKLDDNTASDEIIKNKLFLEELLGVDIRYFAFPNGKRQVDYFQQHPAIVKNLGFFAAVSTDWGVAKKCTNFFELPRFTPWDNDSIWFKLRMIQRYLIG